MPRRTSWLVALVAVAAAALVQAAAYSQPAKEKLASSPEQAVQFVAEAFKAGDPEAVLAQLAEPFRTMMKAQLQAMRLQEAVEAAADKKFGKESDKPPRPSIKESMQAVKKLIVAGKKPLTEDKVELTVWETRHEARTNMDETSEKTWEAVKVGKGWKLILPMGGSSSGKTVTKKGPDGKEVEVLIEKPLKEEYSPGMKEYVEKILPKYLEMIQKHKKNIEEGKYKTRKEARDALGSAMEALRKEFPPPMPRKGGKPAKDKAVKDKDKVTDKE